MVKSASVSVEVRYPSSSGPFLGTTFVSIQPMPTDTSISHAVPTDSTQAPATVMLVVDLGTWKMDFKTMTGGPPGYCNGGSCYTAVFNPMSGPDQDAPLTIDWGDGTTTQIQEYWRYCQNLYVCESFGPPGDGLGEGYAYTNYTEWYHTYEKPGTYVVSAVAASGAAINPTIVTVT